MPNPLLYELNTRCWLHALSLKHGGNVTLATVPESEFETWKRSGFTHIWLMGVWTSGPRARAEALRYPGLRTAYDEALPGWQESEVAGSPYAIGNYRVPDPLGGDAGLAIFRDRLHADGLKLLLDFVPNHLGVDHPWLAERPGLFVQSASAVAGTFQQESGGKGYWLAHGKDPYFDAWTDTAQLDYRRPETRTQMTRLLQSIAGKCDGVRCDMAMLVLNEVFARTWERFPVAGAAPASEFWSTAIQAVRQSHSEFLFLAEAYWGLEGRLRQLGFDYTYDKILYDGIITHDPAGIQRHLFGMGSEGISASAHFLENHDERRAASVLSPAEHRAAALLILGLPGMRFLHEGQLTGARLKLPVQLARRTEEPPQAEIRDLYEQMLQGLQKTAVGSGHAEVLVPRPAWPNNPTAQNFVLVQWQETPPVFDLVVVNLAGHRGQCYAPLTVPGLADRNWSMKDLLGQEVFKRAGEDLQNQGLYLDLPAHGAQLFHFEQAI